MQCSLGSPPVNIFHCLILKFILCSDFLSCFPWCLSVPGSYPGYCYGAKLGSTHLHTVKPVYWHQVVLKPSAELNAMPSTKELTLLWCWKRLLQSPLDSKEIKPVNPKGNQSWIVIETTNTVWVTTNCGKFFKRWECQTTWPTSWEICMQVRKKQLELDMEQQTGSKLGKEYVKAVYYHPAYLTYMQSTSWEMLGWIKHKLESKLPGEISITSDMQTTPPLWQKVKKN